MNVSSILSPADSPSLPVAPLDAVWLFCIASYGCVAGGYPSQRAAIGLFQSGAAVPALSPWGPVPASESKGESHIKCPIIETARQVAALAFAVSANPSAGEEIVARPPPSIANLIYGKA